VRFIFIRSLPLAAFALRRPLLLGALNATKQEFALSSACGCVRAEVSARRPVHLKYARAAELEESRRLSDRPRGGEAAVRTSSCHRRLLLRPRGKLPWMSASALGSLCSRGLQGHTSSSQDYDNPLRVNHPADPRRRRVSPRAGPLCSCACLPLHAAARSSSTRDASWRRAPSSPLQRRRAVGVGRPHCSVHPVEAEHEVERRELRRWRSWQFEEVSALFLSRLLAPSTPPRARLCCHRRRRNVGSRLAFIMQGAAPRRRWSLLTRVFLLLRWCRGWGDGGRGLTRRPTKKERL
jgi:hypothetical protein